MNCRIVIKTNSHYSYLWRIINDLTQNFGEVIVFLNDSKDFEFNKNIKLIYYNQENSYTDRIMSLIEKIDTDYFLLIHDVDLILNFDINKFSKYLDLVIKENIDRLSLGVFDNKKSEIVYDDLHICKLDYNISKNFFTPFDYAPSIYKKKTIYNFYSNFKGESYRNLELNTNAQSYVYDNLLSYGIQKNNNIDLVYHRGFIYTKDFNFLHLTVAGSFLETNTYFDLSDVFLEIKQKYELSFISTQASGHIQKNEI
jgi:hypothetical protein